MRYAQSNPILEPKVPYFVPGGVTQLMIPALHLNPSTLVPATKAGDHHAPQGPQGLQTPDLLCINCPGHNILSKILHSQRYLAMHLRESRRVVHCWGSSRFLKSLRTPDTWQYIVERLARCKYYKFSPAKGTFGESLSRESSTLVHWRGSSCSIRSPGIPDP